MEFGLSLKQKEGLISIFDKHLKQGKVIVYGSRAKGNFTAQSDIDLVIQSSNATDRHLLATIHADIMESDFPYLCDIQYLEEIKSPRLLDHIKRMGKTFYQKESGKMAGWEQATLGIVCEVIAGQSPKGSNYNNSGDGLPFYQGKKEFGDRYLGAPTKWTTQITREATAGDVLMSVRAPVGPINFSTERIVASVVASHPYALKNRFIEISSSTCYSRCKSKLQEAKVPFLRQSTRSRSRAFDSESPSSPSRSES